MPVINKRYLEVKPQLEEVLSNSLRLSRHYFFVVSLFGVVCGLIGVVMYFCWEGQTSDYGYIVGLFGLSTCVIIAGMYVVKNPHRETEKLRAILMYSPELIVWSYTLEKRVNGIENGVYVVMKVRGHDEFSIQKRALLNGDCDAFLQMLAYLNPDMQIGYTKEAKKLHE